MSRTAKRYDIELVQVSNECVELVESKARYGEWYSVDEIQDIVTAAIADTDTREDLVYELNHHILGLDP